MVFVVFFIDIDWLVVLIVGGDCFRMLVSVLVWEVVCWFCFCIGDKYCLGVVIVLVSEVWIEFCDVVLDDCVCVWRDVCWLNFLFVGLVREFVGDLSCLGFRLI